MADAGMVERAVETTMKGSPENVLRAMFDAIYTFKDTKDFSVLERFAEAAVVTVKVHAHPGYQQAAAAAPESPTRRGRSLNEIFGRTG